MLRNLNIILNFLLDFLIAFPFFNYGLPRRKNIWRIRRVCWDLPCQCSTYVFTGFATWGRSLSWSIFIWNPIFFLSDHVQSLKDKSSSKLYLSLQKHFIWYKIWHNWIGAACCYQQLKIRCVVKTVSNNDHFVFEGNNAITTSYLIKLVAFNSNTYYIEKFYFPPFGYH